MDQATRSEELRLRFFAATPRRLVSPGGRTELLSSLHGDREALYDALREHGVNALGWPWVGLVLHEWRLAVSQPLCTLAERREARKRLEGIGGALAGRGRGRVEERNTAQHRAFIDRYLPMLRAHLKLLREDRDLDLRPLTDVERWRYLQLRKARFRARDLNRREPGHKGSAYAILARTLGLDERYVRRLARRS